MEHPAQIEAALGGVDNPASKQDLINTQQEVAETKMFLKF